MTCHRVFAEYFLDNRDKEVKIPFIAKYNNKSIIVYSLNLKERLIFIKRNLLWVHTKRHYSERVQIKSVRPPRLL